MATMNQNYTPSMRQEQSLTQQQIQALQLLSTPMLELPTMVNEELQINPVLDAEPDAESPTAITDDDSWLERILQLDAEDRYIRSGGSAMTPEELEQRQHYLSSATYDVTLHEVLLKQLALADSNELDECCRVVISAIDNDGYLSSHPADLAMAAGVPMESVEEAIALVQQFEPAGVGARDLQERLLLQLQRRGREDSKTYEAVRDHLGELGNNLIPAVARKLKVSMSEMGEIIAEIRGLTPRISVEEVRPDEYIEEEVRVEFRNGALRVLTNNDHLPALRISKHYKRLLQSPDTPAEVRDYIKEKIRSGVFLINCILQRQTTIAKIAKVIVECQEEYFMQGPHMLKPLTMAEVAERVNVHETTVSRTVAGKYMRCKQGLIPMRSMFTTGYRRNDGQVVSNAVVKRTIRELIDNEDKRHPASDSDLVRKLRQHGLEVARRTVAKYRESMGILSSNLRRDFCAAS